jgi:microcystin-dependent protein
MANQYIGEIRMFAGNFAINEWAECNGQLLDISDYTPLFSIIGTFYGGNGTTNFALPDFRSRVPIHMGQGTSLSPYSIGQIGGAENITLTTAEMPGHNHLVACNTGGGNQASPANGYPAVESTGTSLDYNSAATNEVTMNQATIENAGGSQPHPNIQPYLTVTFLIALEGIFPSRN